MFSYSYVTLIVFLSFIFSFDPLPFFVYKKVVYSFPRLRVFSVFEVGKRTSKIPVPVRSDHLYDEIQTVTPRLFCVERGRRKSLLTLQMLMKTTFGCVLCSYDLIVCVCRIT